MIPLPLVLRCIWRAARKTVIDHDGVEHAGYLSFLALLGIFPFLVLLMAIGGLIGDTHIGIEFVRVLIAHMPPDMAKALRPRIDEIVGGPPPGLKTLAIVGAVWTASSGVEGLRTILNRAYHVATPPAYPLRRLMSIVQFLIMTFVILVAMFLLIPLPVAWQRFQEGSRYAELLAPMWTYVRLTLSGLLLFAMVCTAYYVLPNIRQRWRAVMPGALVVVALWMVAAGLLAGYLSNFHQVNFIYGSLEGIIVALLFFYINSLIFIFGAEFNYLLEKATGHIPEQKEPVVPPAR